MNNYVIRFYEKEDFMAISDFCCGVENEPLDLYFKQEAHNDQKSGMSRIYVIESNNKIIGFFALKMASLSECVGNSKKEIPLLQISDFAFDLEHQGKGYGSAVFLKILELANKLRRYVGCLGIMVFAFNENAIKFYKKMGFQEFKSAESEYKDNFNVDCKVFIYSLNKIENIISSE